MADYYADSSVLVKRHVQEHGTDWFQAFQAAGLPSLIFLAADNRLVAVAQTEGLAADNPNKHP